MSDINPEFSFPSPQSAPARPPAPIHTQRPLSFSPQSRPRKHAHRRSAAMSEDLSAVELAHLTTPQMPTPMSFGKASSPEPFSLSPLPVQSFDSSLSTKEGSFFNKNSFDAPRPETRAQVQLISSPVPKRQYQIGEPGQLISNTESYSPPSDGDRINKGSHSRSHSQTHSHERTSTHTMSASSSSSASPISIAQDKHEKRKKRRSFVQLFKRSGTGSGTSSNAESGNHAGGDVFSSKQQLNSSNAKDNRAIESRNDNSKDIGDSAVCRTPKQLSLSPPQSPIGDETLVAPSQLQPPLRTPITQQVPQFTGSPVATPRNSSELFVEPGLAAPTIDLDEALSCSFSHRKQQQDHILESPFSKASSAMGAVLEEEEDEREDSEAESVSSAPWKRQGPGSFLQKTDSICSNSSSVRFKTPTSPHFLAAGSSTSSSDSARKAFNVPLRTNSGSASISYVGPVLQPPSPKASPPRSPRVSFEQVSNLAISEPHNNPMVQMATSKDLNMRPPSTQTPVTNQPSKKGHQRRRSLIDRLMRR